MLLCIVSTIGFATMLSSCNESTSPQQSGFDRRVLLRYTAERMIIPAFTELKGRVTLFDDAIRQMILTPNPSSVANAQSAWINTYTAWQDCAAYNFGPAEFPSGNLNENISTFPASVSKIESFIDKSDTSFQNFDRDSRGFHAAEYLLFSGSQQVIANRFAQSSGSQAYLRSIVRDIRTQVDATLNGWQTTYKEQFSSDNSTATGSAISDLFNAMSMNFEVLKNFKIGVPLGVRAGQTQPEPTKVEAFYSKQSIPMMRTNFRNIESLWYGRVMNSDTQSMGGFENYLTTLTGGKELVASTKNQFAAVNAAMNQFRNDEDLAVLIEQNDPRVHTLHTELQKLTRFLKSEMSSILGIAITYSSGDGD
ncbi:MAG: imelysin family protein [Candidatus Kapabacteria bacterium]|nr:imelysin family protein [Candidatus Kapabacteria bacterium]